MAQVVPLLIMTNSAHTSSRFEKLWAESVPWARRLLVVIALVALIAAVVLEWHSDGRRVARLDTRAVAALAAAVAWPVAAVLLVALLRDALSQFLSSFASRLNKVSLFKVEFELAGLPEASGWAGPSIERVRTPAARPFDSDSVQALFAELEDDKPADYALLDLGAGDQWLSSRLYLFAAILGRVASLPWLVFVSSSVHQLRRHVGIARPEAVERALADRYPHLRVAFEKPYFTQFPQLPSALPVDSQQARIHRRHGAREIVRQFLQELQSPVATGGSDWVQLRPDTYENAEWLTAGDLSIILGEALYRESIVHTPSAPQQLARAIATATGEMVAVVDASGSFVKVVDRNEFLNVLAREWAASQPAA